MNNTDLITAVQQGNLDQVILCIKNGADPKLWNSHALSQAAIHNHLDIVKYLTPLSDVNADCAMALRNAFLHNNTDVINFLWNEVDHALIMETAGFVHRPSPFQLACQHGWYHHALSLAKLPMHRDILWKSLLYLPRVSEDPLCSRIWDELLSRVKESGDDPAYFAVSSWHGKPLPGMNILKIMAQHSAINVKSARCFLDGLAQNWATENHISAVFPIFDQFFDSFVDESKQSIIAKILAYDPILASTLIERCPTTQFLCTDIVKESLHTDMSMLIHMVSVWKTHDYCEDEREFERLENALIARVYDVPEKVWCVVENFNQFLTSKVVQRFIDLHDDQWTAQVCTYISPQTLCKAQELFDDQTRKYFDEYQNRVQHSVLTQELSNCIGTTVVRKI